MWLGHTQWQPITPWNQHLFCVVVISKSSRRWTHFPAPVHWHSLYLYMSSPHLSSWFHCKAIIPALYGISFHLNRFGPLLVETGYIGCWLTAYFLHIPYSFTHTQHSILNTSTPLSLFARWPVWVQNALLPACCSLQNCRSPKTHETASRCRLNDPVIYTLYLATVIHINAKMMSTWHSHKKDRDPYITFIH